jgi:hypothetical protein
MLIVAGIPTCILTVEFILNFKFCSQYDEEAETILGGMTILEAITYTLTCGESQRAAISIQDEYIHSLEQKHKAEMLAAELAEKLEMEALNK